MDQVMAREVVTDQELTVVTDQEVAVETKQVCTHFSNKMNVMYYIKFSKYNN